MPLSLKSTSPQSPHPKSPPRELRTAVLAFVLTLGLAAWAISSGAATSALGVIDRSVDREVLLLFVPLCALVFAIIVEVVRMVTRGTLPENAAPPRALPRGWHPGHGEG